MKYDIIIGNPPYHFIADGANRRSVTTLYHRFMQGAKALEPEYISFIIPARWYAGGKGLDEFRADMLGDGRLVVLVDYADTEDCFPGVEIKGGVCYYLWYRDHTGLTEVRNCKNGYDTDIAYRGVNEYSWFIRDNRAISILNKVRALDTSFLTSKVSSQKPFGMRSNFTDFNTSKVNDEQLKLYANGQQGYVDRIHVSKGTELIDSWKVLTPTNSEGGVLPNRVLGSIFCAKPTEVCTETYLMLGYFGEEVEAINMVKYASTKFFRFMVSLLKNTQANSKEKFSFVPDLPMTEEWTDEKLYGRYGLTPDEIAFIGSKVVNHSKRTSKNAECGG